MNPPDFSPDAPREVPDRPEREFRLSLSGASRLTLARKLASIGCGFLLLALTTVGISMWVVWQLEGGAAAINEAGRMRMRSFQLALQLQHDAVPGQAGDHAVARQRMHELEASLKLLASGDSRRPLAVPQSEEVQFRLRQVHGTWRALRDEAQALMQRPPGPRPATLQVEPFVEQVDALVSAIERQLESRTNALHTFQLLMMVLAVFSSLAILYAAHVVVLDPVARLSRALRAVESGRFDVRVPPGANDELGELAEGFNRMTERLQALYGGLESKVREKTARLEAEQARLQALYDVSTFVAGADTLPELSQGFAARMRGIAGADALAVRWSDEANDRYLLLASDSLPRVLAAEEQCVLTGDCFCGERLTPGVTPAMRVIPIVAEAGVGPAGAKLPMVQRHCEREGFVTLVTLPLMLQHRLLGEIELFYRHEVTFSDTERNLFEALASHLAGAMESLRMAALERESAVAGERQLLAQELHDSIAQSLAFLKIQMTLLRSAMARADQAAVQAAMDELDAGVRESSSDVRELLLHFRIRTQSERIDLALRETLSKFELQTGMATSLQIGGHGLPLPADVQIQVLHIVQEALSNVRKHARARQVWVSMDVTAQGRWWVEVRDDGRGFDVDAGAPDATHVGLSIMKERAARIRAELDIESGAGGTRVRLALPPMSGTDARMAAEI